MATPVLSVAGLRQQYSPRWALDIPALDIHEGEVLAVIGPNGSGKSSLLRILGLLEAPFVGEVRVHGRPVDASHSVSARRRMAAVFQEPWLADMTVADNVALGLGFRGVPPAIAAARVARWLERFGIAHLGERSARWLSGGEAQRAALARALVVEPEVLLLDEPFSGLDAPTRAALLPEVGAILRADRVTAVLVTHDRNEALALADRVAVLMDGRIRQMDETARVFYAPVSEEVARFVGVETIVTGTVIAREGGATVVDVAGRRLEVASEAPPGARVRIGIRPEDVTLAPAAEPPGPSSARNALPGVIVSVTASAHGTHVVVDCGFPLVAGVTPRSVSELGLLAGGRVIAVFTASAAHVIGAGAGG
ncbi:MAG: ABC transporter ATP-binding protein [Candidatus Rokuibacteriota bacterium]